MPDCFEYTCSHCGGEFHSDALDADAIMEYQADFTERERLDKPLLVCDDCYRLLGHCYRLLKGLEAISGMHESSAPKTEADG